MMKIITDIWSLVERQKVRINVATSHQKEVRVGYSEIMQTEYIKSIACNSISTQPYLIFVLLQLILFLYVTMMTGMNEDKTLHLYCRRIQDVIGICDMMLCSSFARHSDGRMYNPDGSPEVRPRYCLGLSDIDDHNTQSNSFTFTSKRLEQTIKKQCDC